jgi:hypothetical protein
MQKQIDRIIPYLEVEIARIAESIKIAADATWCIILNYHIGV